MADIFKITPPEQPTPAERFEQLLDAEIKRMKTAEEAGKIEPPFGQVPLTIEEYREMAEELQLRPTEGQVGKFFHHVTRESDLHKLPLQGLKAVPLIMPHPHGTKVMDADYVNHFGPLYFYMMDKNSFVMDPDKPIFLNAIFSDSFLRKAPDIPFNPTPEEWHQFEEEFREAMVKIIQLLFK